METDIDEIIHTIDNIPQSVDRISIPMTELRKLVEAYKIQEETIISLKKRNKKLKKEANHFLGKALENTTTRFESFISKDSMCW